MFSQQKKQHGLILITVVLLLGLLSLSGMMAFELSQFSYKANHARAAFMTARHNSENARLQAAETLESMLRNNGATIKGVDDGYQEVKTGQSDASMLSESMRYRKDGLAPFMQGEESIKGDVFIQEYPAQLMTNGNGLSQHMAYAGEGLGMGSRLSFSKYYEIRAKGEASLKGQTLEYWTASDYRFIP